jgi:hypothetical protein
MSRWKKVLKWTAVVLLGLVAIALVANACFVWITDIRLERQLAALRAAGDPISLADLARKPIPPEKNAATYLRQAQPELETVYEAIYRANFHQGWGKQWNYGERHILTAEGVGAITRAVTTHPQALRLLEKAAACPDFEAGIDYSVRPSITIINQLSDTYARYRLAAYVLQFYAHALVAQGNRDDAVRWALVMSRLGRFCEDTPTLVGYLIRITLQGMTIEAANAALQTGPVSKPIRDSLDAALALQEPADAFVRAMKGFRAAEMDMFQAYPRRNFWLISRGLWNRRESEFLEQVQAFLVLLQESRPYGVVRNAIRPRRNQPMDFESLSRDPFLGVPTTYECVVTHLARIRCLRVLNALQAHVPKGKDGVPGLKELGLPSATITDPFTGGLLHVKRVPRGWLVYSVGPDGQDDGGQLEDRLDVGVGPPLPVAQPAKK